MPDYTLGRGKIFFMQTGKNGFRRLGNAPDLKVNVATETLEHRNSEGGLKTKDKEIVVESDINASFQLDEPTIENLGLFVLATPPTTTTVTGASVTGEQKTAGVDRYVRLNNFSVTAASIVVKDQPGTTTYVLGTDYEVLASQPWWIRILPGGSITDGQIIQVDYDFTTYTKAQADALTSVTIEGIFYFAAEPASGRIVDLQGKVSIKPEGDLTLIGDDWVAFSFTAEFLKDSQFTGLAEFVDRGVVQAA